MYHLHGQHEPAANRDPSREPARPRAAPEAAASDRAHPEPAAGGATPEHAAGAAKSRVGAPLVEILTSRDGRSSAEPAEARTAAGGQRFLVPVFLSLVIPGLGQLYRGRSLLAAAFLVAAAALWTVGFGWIGHLVAALEAYLAERRA